jgi:hypothetical protein
MPTVIDAQLSAYTDELAFFVARTKLGSVFASTSIFTRMADFATPVVVAHHALQSDFMAGVFCLVLHLSMLVEAAQQGKDCALFHTATVRSDALGCVAWYSARFLLPVSTVFVSGQTMA